MIGARCRDLAIQARRMLGHLLVTLIAIAGCVQRSTATHLLVAAHSARPYAHSAKRKIEIGGAAPGAEPMIMSTDCHGSCRDGVEDLLGLEWICVRMNA
jgi:hypothetical protein